MSTASARSPLVEDAVDGSWLACERTSIRSLNNNTHLLETSRVRDRLVRRTDLDHRVGGKGTSMTPSSLA
jgi:hypothetical protein